MGIRYSYMTAVTWQVGIRLNKKPPNILVKKKEKGGINFSTSVTPRPPRPAAYCLPPTAHRPLPAAHCLLPTACRPRSLPLPLPAPLPPPRRLSPAAAGRPQVKLTYMDEDAVKAILSEYRINSADVRINCDATPDELIDVIEGNRVYMPCVYALNKIDAITMEVWPWAAV